MQNWDTYGNMAHNYFLYNNPDDGLLTWIPWDNNESLQSGNGAMDPDEIEKVSSSWPLINYLIGTYTYKQTFKSYLQQFIDEVFIPSEMTALYESYYDLLQSSAYKEESGRTYIYSSSSFDSAVSTLKSHVTTRNSVITKYLE